jgi:hypothetical protein
MDINSSRASRIRQWCIKSAAVYCRDASNSQQGRQQQQQKLTIKTLATGGWTVAETKTSQQKGDTQQKGGQQQLETPTTVLASASKVKI